ncbi:MAG TPA: YncE family protein [Nitrososphaeraceae archaeon]
MAKSNRDDNCVTNIKQYFISIHVGELPICIVYDSVNNRVYVTNVLPNTVSIIDACTLKVIDTVSVGDNPYGIAYDSVNNKVYATNQTSDSVSVIGATTLKVIDTVSGDRNFILDNPKWYCI